MMSLLQPNQWQKQKQQLKQSRGSVTTSRTSPLFDLSIVFHPQQRPKKQLQKRSRTISTRSNTTNHRQSICKAISLIWRGNHNNNKVVAIIRFTILLHALLYCYFVCFSSHQSISNDFKTIGRQLHINDNNNTRTLLQRQQPTSLRSPSNRTTSTNGRNSGNQLPSKEATSELSHISTVDNITLSNMESAIVVVIVSDRYEGIVPTVASIVKHTKSKPINLVLIGNNLDVNKRVRQHFATNLGTNHNHNHIIRKFTSFSTLEIQTDLMNQGYQPIWTWTEWGSSTRKSVDSSWLRSNHTIHIAEWDDLETHAHVLNHLRFYLPHVSYFRNHSYLYFVDDDVLVQKDLGTIADSAMKNLDVNKGMVTPCNIWIWDSQCHSFNFHNVEKISSILQAPSLYGDRNVCQSPTETHCYPSSYPDFLETMLRNVTNTTKESSNNPRKQKAWNFGFSLFALDNWRRMDLTSRYETVMKESYRQHVFPETSLAFGLGVSYIAFAGAVECWNDSIVKVRDGFGFIEYNRFARTFGTDDFIHTEVDIIHYTGPTKPWVANTTIEARLLQPWLNYMKDERMDIPVQLPNENGKQIFTLLTSDRAGAQWIMSLLDKHPAVCASGESRKPESGFPAHVMQPWGTPWLKMCSIKRGCSFAFVLDAIQDLASSMDRRGRTNRMPARCEMDYIGDNDKLGHHLPRVCNFFRSLDGNYTDGAIAAKWVDAFREENQSLLPCSCPRGTVVKGISIFVEWLLHQNYPNQPMGPALMALNNTAIRGSKIIRLKRRNIWERYLSSVIAQRSNVYHIKSHDEKAAQLQAAGNVTIDIDDMLAKIRNMEAIDMAGDNWAKDHASAALEVYHEDCKLNTSECFRQIFEFLEVDPSFISSTSTNFEAILPSITIGSSSLHITNKGSVEEALAVHGYGKYIGVENFSYLQLLIYDDDEVVDKLQQIFEPKGINATVFGRNHGSHKKYYSKYAGAVPILKRMAPDTIVVLSSHRNVRVSFPPDSDFTRYEAIHGFRHAIDALIQKYPGAIVASADSNCCASALTHTKLGSLFHDDGTRKARSCVSGQSGCEWAGDEKAMPWQIFMKSLAAKRGYADIDNVYLDGSLLGGKASDLLVFISAVKIGEAEDDRAVLADFMFHNPDKLVLDYEYKLFGKDRESLRSINSGCPFKQQGSSAGKMMDLSSTKPLFLDSPRELSCPQGQERINSQMS